jgi:uncharacterized protein YdaU (DUF1376 family)
MSGFSRFDCYPSDFLNGLIGMSADEIAAYVVVIMLQYDGGGPVKYEGRERELSVRAGMSRGRLGKAIAGLLAQDKVELSNGHLHNRRAAKEIAKISEKIEKNRENSAKGGEVTRQKFEQKTNEINVSTGPVGQPNGQPFDSPNYLPSTFSNIKDICPKRVRTTYPELFENFWDGYPTDANMSKKKTFDVWRRLSDEDRENAIASLPGFKGYCSSHPDYRPVHAERYLSQRRFDGHLETARKVSSQVFVLKGTEEWAAWEKFKGKSLPSSKNQNGPGEGWMFPSRFPPARQEVQ